VWRAADCFNEIICYTLAPKNPCCFQLLIQFFPSSNSILEPLLWLSSLAVDKVGPKKKVILSPKSSYILLTRVSRAAMFAICLQSTACTYTICSCNSRLPRNGSQLTPNPGQSTNSAEIRAPSSELLVACVSSRLAASSNYPSELSDFQEIF